MRLFKMSCFTLCLVILSACAIFMKEKQKEFRKVVSIIPAPHFMELKNGYFILTASTPIIVQEAPDSDSLQYAILFWRQLIQKGWGQQPPVKQVSENEGKAIFIHLKKEMELAGREAYELTVRPDKIVITAAAAPGLFYAFQTLRQLLPADFEAGRFSEPTIQIPVLVIKDEPRFVWRGMMLDVSRHFFPKEFIKQCIDYLALHKMNRFHWHLCDDQGWRIEIKKYPKLTEIGAWRVDREDRPWRAREEQKPGEKATYGGFYTQDDIREIVQYAKERFVTIVPEIEMPGHTRAALAAYPQFSCTGGPFTVLPGGYWPIRDIYCAGKDSTFLFLQDILEEVMDLFPGEYIHIGGDEADKTNWKSCADCQRRMVEQGLDSVEKLQSYFIKRMEAFIHSRGKKLIGWDEILEGGLAPRAAVMSWRGYHGGIEAARSGHDVIMTPTEFCYFDYYQGERDMEPEAFGGYLPLSKVYQFDPLPDSLTATEAKHVLGGQANLWTEFVPTPEHAQYMLFPRLAAMAEALWTVPENKNWADFSWRLQAYFRRLEALNIHYAKSAFNVRVNSEVDLKAKKFRVTLHSELPFVQIYYRLDGQEPDQRARLYTEPFELNNSAELTAASFLNGQRVSKITRKTLTLHKASAKPVTFTYPYSPKYSGNGPLTLTNSLNGSLNYNDGQWLGFEGVDLEAVVDLGKIQEVQHIEVGFLNHIGSWIFLPRQVVFSLAEKEGAFRTVQTIVNELPDDHAELVRKVFSVDFPKQKARFVKIYAQNIKECPPWHMGAGGKAWLFVDEIVVK